MFSFNVSLAENPLRTRADLQKSLLRLLKPLEQLYVPGGLYIGNTGASYAPRVALMEGWSRILWGIAPLLAGGSHYEHFARHLNILRAGINPEDPDFWGEPLDRDQRLVEMAAIALSLMLIPDKFWDPLTEKEKTQLYSWLSKIQEREIPSNNWHFFRILVCEAFRKLGLPVNEAKEQESLDLIESCYRGDGWYIDGSNNAFDSYNPFGFHFYGLIYAQTAGYRDPKRATLYKERACLFAPQFMSYFREDGSSIPYGRSLTYRFATVSFFSACAFADIEVIPWSVMKGILLRHLRWWFKQPIFELTGLLSVGFAYPNIAMAEQYNAPGSPYWSLKTYLILALKENHPFWVAEEAPLPEMPSVSSLRIPGYLISRSSEDVQLLCSGRYPGFEAVNAAAKYCKFVYSARFGFSVSHGAWAIEKTGCDSSLVLSEGDGYWRERRHTENQRCGDTWVSSTWKPWSDVAIETTLVACGGWHVRIHVIKSHKPLEVVEGGFSIPKYQGFEQPVVPRIKLGSDALVAFPWATSQIIDLSPYILRHGEIIVMDPNLNILHASGLVPVLRGTIPMGSSILCCAVWAGDTHKAISEFPPSITLFENKDLSILSPDGIPLAHFSLQL